MCIQLTDTGCYYGSQGPGVSTARQIPVTLGVATHKRNGEETNLTVQSSIRNPHRCVFGMGELPQETICAIASHLRDKRDLCNFSLISRAFVAESQRLLFRTVVFHNHRCFHQWYRTITPAHPIIPSYIRTFVVLFDIMFHDPPTGDDPENYIMASEIFTSFTKLEEISLHELTLRDPGHLWVVSNFSVSAPSVRSLRIEDSQCSPGLVVKFIYLFPHLDDLHMEAISTTDRAPYDIPTPSPSLRGRGRLTLADDFCSHLRFLPLRFKRLHLTFLLLNQWGAPLEQNVSILNEFFVACAPTLECLTLYGESPPLPRCIGNSKVNLEPEKALETIEVGRSVDLSPCKRLRTFKLELRELSECHPYIVQLFTSLETIPCIKAITIVFCSSGKSLAGRLRRFGGRWDPVDTQLCRLAELKNGGLRVSVRFDGCRPQLPSSGNSSTFMAKYRCSPYSFTILCDSNVVTPQGIGLQ